MIFVFLHPKLQKSQELLARRLFVCSKQQTLRIVVAERLLEGENRWDRIGQLRNQGLRARHSPDGGAVHFRGRSTNRGSRELERLEERLSPGAGILSSKLPTIIFLCI